MQNAMMFAPQQTLLRQRKCCGSVIKYKDQYMDDCKAASQAYQSQHVLDDVKVCSTSKLAYYYSNEQSCSYISRPPHNAKAQQQLVTITSQSFFKRRLHLLSKDVSDSKPEQGEHLQTPWTLVHQTQKGGGRKDV